MEIRKDIRKGSFLPPYNPIECQVTPGMQLFMRLSYVRRDASDIREYRAGNRGIPKLSEFSRCIKHFLLHSSFPSMIIKSPQSQFNTCNNNIFSFLNLYFDLRKKKNCLSFNQFILNVKLSNYKNSRGLNNCRRNWYTVMDQQRKVFITFLISESWFFVRNRYLAGNWLFFMFINIVR